jgi:catechol 2,3-dioxygenase-like lactoylglutathione lyase family enzyme
MEKSIAWYRDMLGFELIYKLDEMKWCEVQSAIKGVAVGLSQVETPEVKGGATLTWGVTDIDAARATLESHDVRFDGDTITIPEMVKLATFFDPDGNKLMLYQDIARK